MKNSLRFNGMEEQGQENILDLITSFINNKLNVSCSHNDINYLYRVGNINNSRKPRPILINFVTNLKCKEIVNARKLLKNSGISIYEELTKRRYNLLQLAKKKHGRTNAWSLNGKVYVKLNKQTCLLRSEEDL